MKRIEVHSARLGKLMDNTTAARLGKIARFANQISGNGDDTDRGLKLRRLLEEDGFRIVQLREGD